MRLGFREEEPPMSLPDVNSLLGIDALDEEQDMDVYESLSIHFEPSADALRKLAAAGAEEAEYMDDELVNQEDPYLQGLLGPLADD